MLGGVKDSLASSLVLVDAMLPLTIERVKEHQLPWMLMLDKGKTSFACLHKNP